MMDFGLHSEIMGRMDAVLRQYPEVKQALIFGSRARGDFRVGSDIDLAIVSDTRVCSSLRFELDEAVKLYKIDVVDMNDIPEGSFMEQILKHGVQIYPLCGDGDSDMAAGPVGRS